MANGFNFNREEAKFYFKKIRKIIAYADFDSMDVPSVQDMAVELTRLSVILQMKAGTPSSKFDVGPVELEDTWDDPELRKVNPDFKWLNQALVEYGKKEHILSVKYST